MGLTKEIKTRLKIKEVQRIDYFDTRYYKIIYLPVGKTKKLVFDYLTSVTEFLGAYPKPGLTKWRGDVGNDRADQIIIEAFNLGSTVHNAAETIASRGAVIYNPIINPIFKPAEITALRKKYKNNISILRYPKEFLQCSRILEWFKVIKPQKCEIELTVYSLLHKYAGTLDLLFYLPTSGEYMISGSVPMYLYKGWYVADYKTGKYIDNTYKIQLSAYIEAIFEGKPELKKEFRGGLIIHPNNEKIKAGIPGLKTHLLTMTEQRRYFKHFLSIIDVYKIAHPMPTPKELSLPVILTLKGNRK